MTDLPRYLQLLWGQRPAGRRGPKPTRSIVEIGAAAVAIADRLGLDAVSMKSVAHEVGMTAMGLYRYVDSKAELDSVMVDVAYGPPDVEYAPDADWRSRIELWARHVTDRRLAHPWIFHVDTAQAPPLTPNELLWAEAGLAALAGTRLSGRQRMSALVAIDGWATNHVGQSFALGLVGPVRPDSPQGRYFAHIQRLIDPERFPNLATSLRESRQGLSPSYFDDEWRFGIDVLLDCIESLVVPEPPRSPDRPSSSVRR